MGEITEALRRARLGGAAEPDAASKAAESAPRRREPEFPAPPPVESEPGRHAVVSSDKHGLWATRVVVVDGHGAAAESCRHVALRLRRELDARNARSCAVVSALRQEGKTTVVCNLALALASFGKGRSVALVDLDLRKPTVGKSLELPREVGIDDALRGERSLREVCVAIEKPALDVYPVRVAQEEALELLTAPRLEALVRELERRYQTVLFDTAPVLLVPDATVILRHVETAVAVARAGRTLRRAFEHMRELLPAGRLIGSILNEGQLPTPERHYGYYGEDAESDPAEPSKPTPRAG